MVRHRTEAGRYGLDDRFDRAISAAVAGPRPECTDRRPGGPPRSRTLSGGACVKLDEQKYGNWARLLQFSAAGTVAEDTSPHQTLGDMILERVRLGIERRPVGGQPVMEPLNDGAYRRNPAIRCRLALPGGLIRSPRPTTLCSCNCWMARRRSWPSAIAGRAMDSTRPQRWPRVK